MIAVDTDETKLDLAKERGADVVVSAGAQALSDILDLTDGYGADAVFDFVGSQATVDLATTVVAPVGALRIVGIAGGSFSYPSDLTAPVVPWGVDVRRSYGGTRQDQRMVIDLAREGRISVDTQLYPLDEGERAFADLEEGRVRGRAILVP